MVYATTASIYGRGIYGRVMLDPGQPQMDGDTQGYAGWNTVDKVSKEISSIQLCSLWLFEP